jgi:hypothetical protein
MSNFTITFRILVIALFFAGVASAQKFMGIGTDKPNPRSVLELNVEDPINFPQGFMLPRINTVQRNALGTVVGLAAGMSVFDISDNTYYIWNGSAWVAASGGSTTTVIGINGVLVSGSYGTGFTIDGSNLVQTVTGINGIVATSLTGGNFQIDGSGFITSIIGANGVVINKVGQFYTVSGTAMTLASYAGDNLLTTLTGTFPNFTIAGIAQTQSNTTVVGINGAIVQGSGTLYSVNGQNLLTTTTGFSGDVQGTYSALTITGLMGKTITGIPTTNGEVIMYNGTNWIVTSPGMSTQITISGDNIYTTVTGLYPNITIAGIAQAVKYPTITGLGSIVVNTLSGGLFSIDGSAFVTSIIGTNGVLVNKVGQYYTVSGTTMTLASYTGDNLLTTLTGTFPNFTISGIAQTTSYPTITGLGGVAITTLPGGLYSIDGTAFAKTIIGINGILVGTISGGFSIDGTNIATTSLTGTAGLSVVGTGLSKTVSGAGMVVLQQSLVSPIGSAAIVFNTITGVAMLKTLVRIPANAKTVSISLNAYGFVGAASADFYILIGTASSSGSVSSANTDNIVPLTDLDVSSVQGQTVLLKVYGKVSGGETAAYLQGITVTIKD